MNNIVNTIETQIKTKKTTKKELAKKLNVLPSNLSKRWKSGSMKVRELSEICEILDLEIKIEPK